MLSGHRYSWQPQDKKVGNLEITKEMYGNVMYNILETLVYLSFGDICRYVDIFCYRGGGREREGEREREIETKKGE